MVALFAITCDVTCQGLGKHDIRGVCLRTKDVPHRWQGFETLCGLTCVIQGFHHSVEEKCSYSVYRTKGCPHRDRKTNLCCNVALVFLFYDSRKNGTM